MKKIRIPLEQFDLNTFVDKIVDFITSQVSPGINPIDEIVCVEKPGDHPFSHFETERDVLSALEKVGYVFFPFAYVDPEGFFSCANGGSYRLEEDDDQENGIVIGEADRVGYLIQMDDGEVSIVMAVHGAGACVGPLPSVDLVSGGFEEPMIKYIEEFVRP